MSCPGGFIQQRHREIPGGSVGLIGAKQEIGGTVDPNKRFGATFVLAEKRIVFDDAGVFAIVITVVDLNRQARAMGGDDVVVQRQLKKGGIGPGVKGFAGIFKVRTADTQIPDGAFGRLIKREASVGITFKLTPHEGDVPTLVDRHRPLPGGKDAVDKTVGVQQGAAPESGIAVVEEGNIIKFVGPAVLTVHTHFEMGDLGIVNSQIA